MVKGKGSRSEEQGSSIFRLRILYEIVCYLTLDLAPWITNIYTFIEVIPRGE